MTSDEWIEAQAKQLVNDCRKQSGYWDNCMDFIRLVLRQAIQRERERCKAIAGRISDQHWGRFKAQHTGSYDEGRSDGAEEVYTAIERGD